MAKAIEPSVEGAGHDHRRPGAGRRRGGAELPAGVDVDWVCYHHGDTIYWAGAGHGAFGGISIGKLYAVRAENSRVKKKWLSTREDCDRWLYEAGLDKRALREELLDRADIALEAKDHKAGAS